MKFLIKLLLLIAAAASALAQAADLSGIPPNALGLGKSSTNAPAQDRVFYRPYQTADGVTYLAPANAQIGGTNLSFPRPISRTNALTLRRATHPIRGVAAFASNETNLIVHFPAPFPDANYTVANLTFTNAPPDPLPIIGYHDLTPEGFTFTTYTGPFVGTFNFTVIPKLVFNTKPTKQTK